MWRVYSLHHTSVFTYSHANTPLGQSERAYYLSYFIKGNGYEGRQTSKVLNNRGSYNLKVPIT